MTASRGRTPPTVALSVMVPSWEPTLGASWSWKVPGRRGWVRVQADRLSCPHLPGPHRWHFLQTRAVSPAGRREAGVAVVGTQPPVCGAAWLRSRRMGNAPHWVSSAFYPLCSNLVCSLGRNRPDIENRGTGLLTSSQGESVQPGATVPSRGRAAAAPCGCTSPLGRWRGVSQVF